MFTRHMTMYLWQKVMVAVCVVLFFFLHHYFCISHLFGTEPHRSVRGELTEEEQTKVSNFFFQLRCLCTKASCKTLFMLQIPPLLRVRAPADDGDKSRSRIQIFLFLFLGFSPTKISSNYFSLVFTSKINRFHTQKRRNTCETIFRNRTKSF